MTGLVVAIDGPSGTGKSTISRRLASELGLAYLDTGAMYRVATWWCLHLGLDLTDHEAVAEAVRTIPMEIGTDPAHPTFAVDGQDVAGEIRSTRISAAVSAVATNLGVRPELQRRQREAIAAELRPGSFSQGRGVIAEGRDITTVVAPERRYGSCCSPTPMPGWNGAPGSCTALQTLRRSPPPGTRWSAGTRTTPLSPTSPPPPTVWSPWTPRPSPWTKRWPRCGP